MMLSATALDELIREKDAVLADFTLEMGKISIVQAQLKNAEKQLSEKSSQIFQCNGEIRSLKSTQGLTEEKLHDRDREIQGLKLKVGTYKNRGIELEDTIDVCKNKILAISEQLTKVIAANTSLLDKNSRLQDLAHNLQKAKENSDMTADKLHRQLSELEEVNSDISHSEKQLINEVSALREHQAEIESANESLLQEISRLQHAGYDAKHSLESRINKQNEIADVFNTLEDGGLRAKHLSTHGEEVNRLLQENNILRLKIDSVVRKDAEKQAELDNLRRTAAEYLEKFKAKKDEVQALSEIRRKQHNAIMELKGNIRVFCRVRPFLSGEAGDGETLNFTIAEDKTIKALPPDNKRADSNTEFSFDRVFGPGAQQEDVFVEISELVRSALDGYRVCIFAYGQTGSGKTHTMIGGNSEDTIGMIPRSVEEIFEVTAGMKERGWSFKFTTSFIEIYNESCRDLLVKANAKDKKLRVKIDPKTNKVTVPGLTTEDVSNKAEILRLLARSNKNRVTAETAMNEKSSRSHSVFRLEIEAHNSEIGATRNGGLNLVDLSGSERLKKSEAEGDRLIETRNINKSLSALSNVIASLANGTKHIPYRSSKLTTFLSDSLNRESKTLMFVNVGPSRSSYSESLSSLRFASRANKCHIGTAKRKTKIDSE